MVRVVVIAKLLMHDKPAEVNAPALDALLSIELKAVAVEEGPGGKTGMGGDSRDSERAQGRLDALVEFGGNAPTGKRGMGKKEVEVPIVSVGSETCENTVRLGDNGVKVTKPFLPARSIGRDGRPRRNLFGRVVRRCQSSNRSRISLDDALQVGWFIVSFVHKMRGAALPKHKISRREPGATSPG